MQTNLGVPATDLPHLRRISHGGGCLGNERFGNQLVQSREYGGWLSVNKSSCLKLFLSFSWGNSTLLWLTNARSFCLCFTRLWSFEPLVVAHSVPIVYESTCYRTWSLADLEVATTNVWQSWECNTVPTSRRWWALDQIRIRYDAKKATRHRLSLVGRWPLTACWAHTHSSCISSLCSWITHQKPGSVQQAHHRFGCCTSPWRPSGPTSSRNCGRSWHCSFQIDISPGGAFPHRIIPKALTYSAIWNTIYRPITKVM